MEIISLILLLSGVVLLLLLKKNVFKDSYKKYLSFLGIFLIVIGLLGGFYILIEGIKEGWNSYKQTQ